MVQSMGGGSRRGCAESQPLALEMEAAEVATAEAEAEAEAAAAADAEAARHERLVAYVRALEHHHEAVDGGVWGEHSYARGRAAAGALRVMLGGGAGPPEGPVDVERAGGARPAWPLSPRPEPAFGAGSDSASEGSESEWEERVGAAAAEAGAGAAGARLAAAALASLRRVRLARLAAGRRAEYAALQEEARRLRLALGAARVTVARARWLPAALHAHAPPSARRTYRRLLALLPRRAPPPPPPAAPGPWLAWLGGGRWARRLGALLALRPVPLAASASTGTAPPEPWCAARAAHVRAALADILAAASAQGRSVVVGGAGGAAALAASAAAGAAAAGLLLLAPAMLTAEGPRDLVPANAPPVLLVLGGAAHAATRGAGVGVVATRGRRVLLVAGADDQLRLPAHARRRRALPQEAIDAAIAEECARWAVEVCEAPERVDDGGDDAGTVTIHAGGDSDEEEYAHLAVGGRAPTATTATTAPTAAAGGNQRSIEIVDGRVVSRGSGSTPLTLLPPRRDADVGVGVGVGSSVGVGAGAGALAAADIINMPIVFADDERTLAPDDARLTVTSGGGGGGGGGSGSGGGGGGGYKYTRVIVAKRGRGVPTARPLLLRRGLRIVPRQ